MKLLCTSKGLKSVICTKEFYDYRIGEIVQYPVQLNKRLLNARNDVYYTIKYRKPFSTIQGQGIVQFISSMELIEYLRIANKVQIFIEGNEIAFRKGQFYIRNPKRQFCTIDENNDIDFDIELHNMKSTISDLSIKMEICTKRYLKTRFFKSWLQVNIKTLFNIHSLSTLYERG